ncbi:hypothetical protein [Nocardioides convexus]|uniref:hypothetical protein n=1 Tax=Nocardioides convexus TaxID=2712224 RepID=UPI0024186998|nr:hypothetical protein [Nocardioides convexus]
MKGLGMLRVTLRGAGLPTVVLGSGETLLFGRAPHQALPEDPDASLALTALALPRCAPHVSRLLGEPGRRRGDRTAALARRGRDPGVQPVRRPGRRAAGHRHRGDVPAARRGGERADGDAWAPVRPVVVRRPDDRRRREPGRAGPGGTPPDRGGGAWRAPSPRPRRRLVRLTREWYVAPALAEPWLTGTDDYPRPPSNREIFERVLGWHGYAWNLERAQRVDDAIRAISRLAFGPRDDPFQAGSGRAQNVRFAIGRRAAEVRLVTAEDLDLVERAAQRRLADRKVPPPQASPPAP